MKLLLTVIWLEQVVILHQGILDGTADLRGICLRELHQVRVEADDLRRK